MNKNQKRLILISIIIFLFVTLNPSVFRIGPYALWGRGAGTPYFTARPMYQYWAVIAVPTIALFYYFKDKKDN